MHGTLSKAGREGLPASLAQIGGGAEEARNENVRDVLRLGWTNKTAAMACAHGCRQPRSPQ